MNELLNQLYERWREAHDEIKKLETHKAAGRTIRYAEKRRYPLSGYETGNFPSDGPLASEKAPSSIQTYYFDETGNPVFVSVNPRERLYAFYSYSPDLVEYIEFNLTTGIRDNAQARINTYNYLPTGELDTIQSIHGDGRTFLAYIRLEPGWDPEKACDDLADRLAALIIETLLANRVEEPIALLQIPYIAVTRWRPGLIPTSQADKIRIANSGDGKYFFEHIFYPDIPGALSLDITPMERSWEQFFQYVDADPECDLGTKMLTKTARILTLGKLDRKGWL